MERACQAGNDAIAIRAVIDAAPGRLADPAFDIDQYAGEAVTIFDCGVSLI